VATIHGTLVEVKIAIMHFGGKKFTIANFNNVPRLKNYSFTMNFLHKIISLLITSKLILEVSRFAINKEDIF